MAAPQAQVNVRNRRNAPRERSRLRGSSPAVPQAQVNVRNPPQRPARTLAFARQFTGHAAGTGEREEPAAAPHPNALAFGWL